MGSKEAQIVTANTVPRCFGCITANPEVTHHFPASVLINAAASTNPNRKDHPQPRKPAKLIFPVSCFPGPCFSVNPLTP